MTTARSVSFLLLAIAVATTNAFIVTLPKRSALLTTARAQPVQSFKPLLQSSSSSLRAASADEEVVINKDFRLAGIFLALGILLDNIPWIQFTLGPLVTLLGVLFLVQTFRVSFVCSSSAFELQNGGKEPGENVVVGGENRWTYGKFVNYEFFPKGWIDQPQGPILVYFKENQTPSDKWGKSKNGQIHFFPAMCDTKQLKAEWERRGCNKL
jgi:hypothetical protein